MKASTDTPLRPALRAALRRRARGGSVVSFADFMEVAMYEPEIGYYRRSAPRIGYGPGTDYFTAASSPLFARLVVESCIGLLGPLSPEDVQFVEIGAEGGGILHGRSHPFRSLRPLGIGEPLKIEGPSVVFSNELLDAQPFRRFRFRAGSWRELGVCFEGDPWTEVELGSLEPAFSLLPESAPECYQIDAPLAAARLVREIGMQPWTGLFLAFDYGKSWEEIAFGTPAGTARSYRRHTQENELLASPGERDLTCHVCWDWIEDAVAEGGFSKPTLESQEAFFIRHAATLLETVAAEEASSLSRQKLSLMQLLHPAHMGQKFQALWALR